jgi:uncharacterized protein (DUF2267 family)
LLRDMRMEATKSFIQSVAAGCEIDERQSEELCALVFEGLARSMGYTAGVQFAMQLPYKFQTSLLKSYDGPDHSITAQSLVHDVADLLVVPAEGARQYLREVWHALQLYCDHNQLVRTMEQLPPDVLELFVRPTSPVMHDFEQWLRP